MLEQVVRDGREHAAHGHQLGAFVGDRHDESEVGEGDVGLATPSPQVDERAVLQSVEDLAALLARSAGACLRAPQNISATLKLVNLLSPHTIASTFSSVTKSTTCGW